jgi:hypothetical protein
VTRIVKFILKKTERKQKPAKPPKPQSRVIEHRSLGSCVVVGVFLTGAGAVVVDCDVAGVRRTLSLDQGYWLTPIADLLTALPPQSRPIKQEKPVREAAVEPEEAELVPGVDGHLRDGEDAEAEDDEDVEREESELVSADVLR